MANIDDGSCTGMPIFTVSSGPCEVSEGGQCVGRPNGYGPSESCTIIVGAGGLLGECSVFDTMDYVRTSSVGDALTLPDGSTHSGSDCPVGVALAPGDTMSWESDDRWQGTVGCEYSAAFSVDGRVECSNGCATNGT